MSNAIEANNIAKKEYTLSSMFNKIKKDNNDGENFILQSFNKNLDGIKGNDIQTNIILDPQGFNILKAFCKHFWDKERKTANGSTWNLYENCVTNKGKASMWYINQLFKNVVEMEGNKFNEIVSFTKNYKPKKAEKFVPTFKNKRNEIAEYCEAMGIKTDKMTKKQLLAAISKAA